MIMIVRKTTFTGVENCHKMRHARMETEGRKIVTQKARGTLKVNGQGRKTKVSRKINAAMRRGKGGAGAKDGQDQ